MAPETVTIEYPTPVYSLFSTSRGGLPAIVVVNAALRDFAHQDVFPWHLSVIIEASDLAESGMPTGDESRILDALGDRIEGAVLETRNAIFLARQTWNAQRQLLYRVNDPDVAAKALQALIDGGRKEREWEFRMWGDDEWAEAGPYLSLLETATAEGDA